MQWDTFFAARSNNDGAVQKVLKTLILFLG